MPSAAQADEATADSKICPRCGADSGRTLFPLTKHAIWRCSECSTLYNPDFPPSETPERTFDETYYLELQKEAFEDALDDHASDPSFPAFTKGLQQLDDLPVRDKMQTFCWCSPSYRTS